MSPGVGGLSNLVYKWNKKTKWKKTWNSHFLLKNVNGFTISLNLNWHFYHSIWTFQRYVRDISTHARFLRHISTNSTLKATLAMPANNFQRSSFNQHDSLGLNHRSKRQSTGRREQLCQTTYQYITPQAALNSQGKINKF